MFNACIDHRRKVVPFFTGDIAETADTSSNPEEVLREKQSAKKVRVALQKLPERQRAVVVLSYYEGIRNQQAAEAMGLELGSFQQLLFRARQTLKEELIDGVAGLGWPK